MTSGAVSYADLHFWILLAAQVESTLLLFYSFYAIALAVKKAPQGRFAIELGSLLK